MIVGFPRMQRLWPRRPSGTPLWRFLVAEAEAAAQAAGASLWYVPPEVHADTVTVNSDGTGGRPALGTGPVGRVLSRGTLGNNATQSTSANRPVLVAAPGAAAAAAGFGAVLGDGVNDLLSTSGQILDMNGNWFIGCAFRAVTNSGFPWPIAGHWTAGQRVGVYLQNDGRAFGLMRRNDGFTTDLDINLSPATPAGETRVIFFERVGGSVTAYNPDGSFRGRATPTFGTYNTGGVARIGGGDSPLNGTVSVAMCGQGTVSASQRAAFLNLMNLVG